jgi:hypothetical protein
MKPQQCFWKVKLHNSYRRMEWKGRDTNSALELMGLKSAVGCHAFFRSTFSTHVNLPNFPHHTDCGSARIGSMGANKSVSSLDIIGNRFQDSEEIGKTSRSQVQAFLMVAGPSLLFSCVLDVTRKRKRFVVARGNLKWAWKRFIFHFWTQLDYIQYVHMLCDPES